jgi:CubicO group peptidase (beta-lactamase class C family)
MTAGLAGLDDAFAAIGTWGADHAAVAIVGPDGIVATHGDTRRRFRWASPTKLVTALAILRAVEAGTVALDEAAGPVGSTVRHLLGHASGLPFEGSSVLAPPGQRRIYSNAGYDALGGLLAQRAGGGIGSVVGRSVLDPLGMTGTALLERPSQGLHGTLADLAALAREVLRPTLLAPAMHAAMTAIAFPGLAGTLPGVGPFDDCAWGLGPEVRGAKTPHWTGTRNSGRTVGHFGGSGTFVWVDPTADVALACLTDREFGPWALRSWPALSDAVLDAWPEAAPGGRLARWSEPA